MPGLLAEIATGESAGAHAAVIACFDDTGLDAARAMAAIPVIGICEAALASAAFVAQRFTVVTTLERSRVPLEDLVQRYGMAGRAKVRAADIPVLSLEDPHPAPATGCAARSRAALRDDRAEAIVLGCAGMADLAARPAARVRRAGDRRRRRRGQAGRGAGRARPDDRPSAAPMQRRSPRSTPASWRLSRRPCPDRQYEERRRRRSSARAAQAQPDAGQDHREQRIQAPATRSCAAVAL